jgi:hypothetical protein
LLDMPPNFARAVAWRVALSTMSVVSCIIVLSTKGKLMTTKPCFLCSVAVPVHLVLLKNDNVFLSCDACITTYPKRIVKTVIPLG